MNVTIFKNVKTATTGHNCSVYKILDRIKQGKSKDAIELIRTLPYDEYQVKKKELPSVCFNGTFNHRSEKGLIKKSGLIILDFDKFESNRQAIEYKLTLSMDPYIFACWISPGGTGVKALVKIPIDDKHKQYFDALKEHFDSSHWDNAGSDVSRLCIESYDPELFLNVESNTWVEYSQPDYESIGTSNPIIPLKSENRIIDNLLKWWGKKYGNAKGNRNSNIFILGCAFNDFGISKHETEMVFSKFIEPDFKESEIHQLINSAYKNTHNFGTKFFEDAKLRQQIQKQIITGKKTKDIVKNFPQIKESEIDTCVSAIRDNISIDVFWTFNDEGRITLCPHKFKFWLQQNNFFKYFPVESNTYTFIRKDQNLIEETNEKRIKDFVLNNLLERNEEGFMPYDFMATSTKYFTSEFLSFLESAEVSLKEDTLTDCFLYYKNCVVKVTKDNIEIVDYIDIDGFVWKKQIINRDFEQMDYEGSEFARFIFLISGKSLEKFNSLKSVIGYLLHSYKTSANNKAIIFNDETISENPNGGSGKGLFCNAIGKMKKVSRIDGKAFEFTKSFPYQTVSADTQILVFDDVKKNFNFESLFSLITEGITLEYKGQDALVIPVEKSPKILITTNYTIGGVGGSHERRKFEVELSNFFSINHTPLDEFGHMLFDWSKTEWQKFDNFMISCSQYYLKNGLVKHDFHNLEVRKFIKETSYEFYEWTNEDNIPLNDNIDKKEYFERFISEYPDFKKWLSQKKFTTWLETFGHFHSYKVTSGRSTYRWIRFDNGVKANPNLNNEMDFTVNKDVEF